MDDVDFKKIRIGGWKCKNKNQNRDHWRIKTKQSSLPVHTHLLISFHWLTSYILFKIASLAWLHKTTGNGCILNYIGELSSFGNVPTHNWKCYTLRCDASEYCTYGVHRASAPLTTRRA
jgi:hypothetical protein